MRPLAQHLPQFSDIAEGQRRLYRLGLRQTFMSPAGHWIVVFGGDNSIPVIILHRERFLQHPVEKDVDVVVVIDARCCIECESVPKARRAIALAQEVVGISFQIQFVEVVEQELVEGSHLF